MTKDSSQAFISIGLLILRVTIGGMMLAGHGWGKLIHFGEKVSVFPDPIGLGSLVSLSLTVFAEVFCSIAIILGIFTQAAAAPLIITMFVAVFFVHEGDPWQKKELALLYLVPFLTLVFTGAGRFSLDTLFFDKNTITKRMTAKEKLEYAKTHGVLLKELYSANGMLSEPELDKKISEVERVKREKLLRTIAVISAFAAVISAIAAWIAVSKIQ